MFGPTSSRLANSGNAKKYCCCFIDFNISYRHIPVKTFGKLKTKYITFLLEQLNNKIEQKL